MKIGDSVVIERDSADELVLAGSRVGISGLASFDDEQRSFENIRNVDSGTRGIVVGLRSDSVAAQGRGFVRLWVAVLTAEKGVVWFTDRWVRGTDERR